MDNELKYSRSSEASAVVFTPRDNLMSWRSKECTILNHDGCLYEDEEPGETTGQHEAKEQTSCENLPDSRSVQDLASLFSRLALHDVVENLERDSEDNPVERRRIPTPSNTYNVQDPSVENGKVSNLEKNEDLKNFFSFHYQPQYSRPGRREGALVCKSTNIRTDSNFTKTRSERARFYQPNNGNSCSRVFSSTEVLSFESNHSFINPLGFLHRYRSRFAVFLLNLLTRAGRLKENFDSSDREDISIFDHDSLSQEDEITVEVQQKNSEHPIHRIPSEREECHPEEQVISLEHSGAAIAGSSSSFFGYDFCDEGATKSIWQKRCMKKPSLRKVHEPMLLPKRNEESIFIVEPDSTIGKERFHQNAVLTLVKKLEDEAVEQEIYADNVRSFVEGREVDIEEELTLIAEQDQLSPGQDIPLDTELTLVAEENTFSLEPGIYSDEQPTELGDGSKEEHLSTENQDKDGKGASAFVVEIKNSLAENGGRQEEQIDCLSGERVNRIDRQEARLKDRGNNLEGQAICIDEQGTYLEDQATFPGEQGTFLGHQDTYLGDQGTNLRDQETFHGDLEAYFREQETYPGNQRTYLGNQRTYLGGQDAYLGDRDAYLGDQENSLKDLKAYLKEQETSLGDQEIYLEAQESNFEKQESFLERHVTCVDDQEQGQRVHEIYLERQETFFEGLGEETFRTVRNVSPRAKDLFRRALFR